MLISKLAEQKYYCITADIWSGRNRSFLGMTIHWINPNFERQSRILALKRFTGTHDSEAITEKMLGVLETFGITKEKITSTVTDNASNFVKAFTDHGIHFENNSGDTDEGEDEEPQIVPFPDSGQLLSVHTRCASHTLSLVATTDLDNVNFYQGILFMDYFNTVCKNIFKMF